MAGMWELPTIESGPDAHLWPKRYDERLRQAKLRRGAVVAELSHGITHHRIRAVLRRASLRESPAVEAGLRWASREEFGELALTGLTKKAWRRVQAFG